MARYRYVGPQAVPLYLLWRKVKCLCVVFKVAFVRAIAKGFVGRKTTAAYRNHGASLQAVNIALHIYDFKIAINLH